MIEYELNRWYRASPVSLLFFLGKSIRWALTNFQNIVLPNAVLVGWLLSQRNWFVIIGLVVLWLVALVLFALIRYWRFKFQLSEDSISVRQGVIAETHVDLQFDRIRAVNFRRGIVDRWFRLTGMSFDTAGGSGAEATIPAVPVSFAERLRTKIKDRRTEEGERSEARTPVEEDTNATPLLEYRMPEIIKIGLCSGNVATTVAPLAFIPAFVAQFDFLDEFGTTVLRNIYSVHSWLEPSLGTNLIWTLITLEVILVLLTVGVLFVLLAAVFRWHGFKLFAQASILKSIAGLTTVQEVRLDVPKIQSVVLKETIRSRWFSFFRFTARQSESAEEHRLEIPYSKASTNLQLCSLVLDEAMAGLTVVPTSDKFATISPAFFWVGLARAGLIPWLLSSLVAAQFFGFRFMLWASPWLLIVALFRFLQWRKEGYMYNQQAMVYRSGVFSYQLIFMKFHKVQCVAVHQSAIQRWTGKASLLLTNATSSVAIPYLNLEFANRLRDYILYVVESSQEEWR